MLFFIFSKKFIYSSISAYIYQNRKTGNLEPEPKFCDNSATDKFLKIIQFKGVNFRAIIMHLLNSEPNKVVSMDGIRKICLITACRGFNGNQLANCSKAELKLIWLSLEENYKIVRLGYKLLSGTINLPKVVHFFPLICFSVNQTVLDSALRMHFPVFLRCSTIFSVIKPRCTAQVLFLLHARYLDRVINRKTRRFAKKSDIRFAETHANGSLVPFNKKNSCKQLMIFQHYLM